MSDIIYASNKPWKDTGERFPSKHAKYESDCENCGCKIWGRKADILSGRTNKQFCIECSSSINGKKLKEKLKRASESESKLEAALELLREAKLIAKENFGNGISTHLKINEWAKNPKLKQLIGEGEL